MTLAGAVKSTLLRQTFQSAVNFGGSRIFLAPAPQVDLVVKRLGDKKVTVKEIIADIGAILTKVNVALNDHEQRLQLIEEIDPKIELDLLHTRILAISEPKKQATLQAFWNLCDSLGIQDLESCSFSAKSEVY